MSDGRPVLLYLVAEPPWPTTSGGRMHAANLAKGLAAHFNVRVLYPGVVSAVPSTWSAASARMEALRSSTAVRIWHAIAALARGTHISLERAQAAGLLDAYREVLELSRPAVVVLGRPFVGPFIDLGRRVEAAVVIDADEDLVPVAAGILLHGPTAAARLRALHDFFSISRMQRREYGKADQVWVTSEREASRFRYLGNRVRVLPNVIELDPNAPIGSAVSAVAFVGWYGYAPNESAALELIGTIMPLVHRMGGPRQLLLVGRDPSRAMHRAARGRDWVQITGEVPETRPLLRAAGIMAAPIRSGGGTRVKILEAIAAGVPVASTSFGVAGLGLRPGADVLVADSPTEMAAAICRLARDDTLRRQLVNSGQTAIRRRHSPEALAAALSSALRDLAPRPHTVERPRVRQ
jgi:glycosyltransferase involved in cell wall biosynthesis